MYSAKHQAALIAVLSWTLMSSTGCNSLGAGKQLKQLEVENNRLLSEFRAERQRRESAERTAQQLEMRLAESEKMLARQLQTGSSQGRLSSLPQSSSSFDVQSPGSLASGPRSGNMLNDPNSLPGTNSPIGSGSDLKWHRRN